jgi:hypothetical protein
VYLLDIAVGRGMVELDNADWFPMTLGNAQRFETATV